MSRLVIIDGNAIVHRAYHALPPLTSRDGKLVNAVYGFTTMLLRVISDLKPTHLAVAFDRPEPTFRKELFKEYQSHRPKMEDELSGQFSIVQEVVTAMKIPIFEKAGYEADDIIGTLANKIKDQKAKSKEQSITSPKSPPSQGGEGGGLIDDVVIVTGDRDILQLVDEATKVYMPVKGLSEGKLYDKVAVKEKFGIESSQIVDYKALVGDSSDNYPGVAGIGPKTAADLLSRYHSLEGLYKNLGKEKNEKLVAKLRAGEKDAEMAKELATIVTNVSVEVDLNLCQLHPLDTPEVETVLEKLAFKSLLTRIKGKEKEKPAKKEEKKKEDNNQLSFL